MAGYDGSIKIDSSLDSGGIEKGLKVAGVAIAGALSAVAVASVKMGADFYQAMSEVQAISGASSADLERLTATAKEMGATTKFSASESAEALKYMAMAGWDAEQMIGGLPGIMNLAAASGESLGTVSDIVTDALTAMGLQASDAAHFADVLAVAASASNTNVGMMGQTFKYAAPLAGALKYSVEDLSVVIGLMANSGIKADQAGTALRAMLTRMVKPTKDSAAAMDKLKLEIKNADGTMRPLNDVIVDMRAGFENLTDAEKTQYAAMLAGQEAMSGLLSIVNASDEDFESLTAAINDANGAAGEMARVMNDNLKGDVIILGSALEGLSIQIFEAFNRPLREAAQAATEAVGQISTEFARADMQESLAKIGDAIGGVVKAVAKFAADAIPKLVDAIVWVLDNMDSLVEMAKIAAAAFAGFKIAGVIAGITKAVQGLSTALAANPWGIAAAAIAAIGVAVYNLVSAQGEASSQTKAYAEEIDGLVSKTNKLSETVEKSSRAYDSTKGAIQTQANETVLLIKELSALNAETSLTSDQKKRLLAIVDELNSRIPGLNLAYNEQAEMLNYTTAQLNALAEAEEARQQKTAAEDRISALRKMQAEATENLTRAELELTLAMQDQNYQILKADGAKAYAKDIALYEESFDKLRSAIQQEGATIEEITRLIAEAGEDAAASAQNLADAEAIIAEENQRASEQTAAATAQYKQLSEETDALIEAKNDYISKLKDESAAYAKIKSEIKTEAALMGDLVSRIDNLASASNRSASEQSELLSLIDMFNESVPAAKLALDEETGALNMSADALRTYADAQEAALAYEAAKERYAELSRQQLEIDQEYAEIAQQITEVQNERAAAQELLNVLMGENKEKADENAASIKILSDIITGYDEDLGLLGAQTEEYKNKQDDLAAATTDASAEMVTAQETVNEARQQGIYVMEEEAAAHEKALEEMAKNEEKKRQEIDDAMRKAYERYSAMTQNFYDTIDTKQKASLKEVTANLNENAKITEAWVNNLEALTKRGVDDGVIAKLREMGPSSSGLVADMVKASDKELAELETAFRKSTEAAASAAEAEILAAYGPMENASSGMFDQMGTAFLDNLALVEASKTTIKNVKTAVDSQITASDFPAAGRSVDDSLATGVRGNAEKVQSDGKAVITSTHSAMQSQITASNFGSLGVRIIDQIVSAINSNASRVAGAARSAMSVATTPSTATSPLPQHKAGLDYVPKDNYLALLHKGETVLDAKEADILRSFGGIDGLLDTMAAAAQTQSNRTLQSMGGGYREPLFSPPASAIDYERLARAIWEAEPEREPGDVYLDDVKVGEIIEPRVSAVQAARRQAVERSGAYG